MKSALLAGVTAALLASGAAAEPSLESAKKCPRGKVAVKILGKRSCRPMAAALPRPRKGDELVPVLQQGIDPTWGETRDGPPTLNQLLGAETKRALDLALQRSLGRLSAAGQRQLSSALARAAAKCKSDRVLPVTSESFKEDLGGGNQMDVRMSTGAEGAKMTMSVTLQQGGGRAVRISIDLGLCSGEALHTDACPTAQGVVEGTDNYGGTITTQELEDGEVVSAQVVKVTVETKLRGQVEDDAKLSEIRIERTESYDVAVTHGRWLGVGQKSKATRKATISMPSGTYSSQSSSLELQQSFSGILSFLVNESAAKAAAVADLERASNDAWAGFVKEALDAYRKRENAWQKAPFPCARLEFSPKSNTLKLKVGQEGRASGTIQATAGGSPTGRWKVVARKNLGIRLGQDRGATIAFSYRADATGTVSATFRVTSKAGVAEGTWEQGTDKLPKRIAGTFSGKTANDFTWEGTISFVRNAERSSAVWAWYDVEKVTFTVTYTVKDSFCTGRASATGTFGRTASESLLLAPESDGPRGHRYAIKAAFLGPPATIAVTCAGVTIENPWRATASLLAGNVNAGQSPYFTDLKAFAGTSSIAGTWSHTWDLRGSS